MTPIERIPSARGAAVLGRFPSHLSATDPGKRIGAVVAALAGALDVLTRQVGDVRSAHRIDQAPTPRDLLALVAVHGLGEQALRPLHARLAAIAATVDPAELTDLTGVPVAALSELGADLAAVAAGPNRSAPRLAARRAVLLGVIGAQAGGGATAPALLRATAAYLGLEVELITPTAGRWWHLARCRDALRLVAPVPPGPDLTPRPDVLALEENPFRTADREPAPRHHAERFEVLRGGMEEVPVGVRVRGTGTRTVRPMVVRLDRDPPGAPPAVRGLVYEGTVPDGEELVFGASGQVRLGGVDVTGSAWSFSGAVFASGAEALPGHDFVFAGPPDGAGGGRVATFAATAPVPDAFTPTAVLPHGSPAAGPLRMPVGRSRWAGFVRIAHTAANATDPVVPCTVAGRFDAAVFASPAPAQAMEPSLHVGFAWEEREPFALRIVLPRRFRRLDPDPGTVLRDPLRRLLDRHRAAGIAVRVEFADPRWTLGVGVLADPVADPAADPIAATLAGTELWADGTPQPTRRRP